MKTRFIVSGLVLMAFPLAVGAWHNPPEEFDEFEPFIEINATDGDVGFHVLLDGEAWKRAAIFDSDWDRMMKARATDDLEEQGVTEFFLESAEPLCFFDEEEPDAEVVTLEEFVERFEEGTYHARGLTLDLVRLVAEADFTHNIPAAPETEVEIEFEDGDIEVEISWETGEDLGECEYPEGLIPDPAEVEVVRWEVVVEPDEDQVEEAGVVFGVFSVQLPGDVNEVEISEEFIQRYVDAGVTTFKYEVGAKEESGNQTFTEDEFDIFGEEEE